MTAARPRVARTRSQARAGGRYSRAERAKGDAHRQKSIREDTAGLPHKRRVTPATRAKLAAAARRRPRDVLGRFEGIVRRESDRARDEIIWGKQTRTHAKSVPRKGEPHTRGRGERANPHLAAQRAKQRRRK